MSFKETIEKAHEELAQSGSAELLAKVGEDLPTEGAEASILGSILGVWIGRGAPPDLVKQVVGAIVDVLVKEMAEPVLGPAEELDDNGILS